MNEALHILGICLLRYFTFLSKYIVFLLCINIIVFNEQSNEGSIVCIFKIRVKLPLMMAYGQTSHGFQNVLLTVQVSDSYQLENYN